MTSSPSFRKEIPTASCKFCKIASVGTFDPCGHCPDLSPGTHVVSVACGNLLYEIAISSRIDMRNVIAREPFKRKRHANPALKDGVCACPLDQITHWMPLPKPPTEDQYIGGYFPPPWNPSEHPEKTAAWIAFQEEQRKDPAYYGCGEKKKSEEVCLTKLADQYIDEWDPLPFCRYAEMEAPYIKGVYDFSDWLRLKIKPLTKS